MIDPIAVLIVVAICICGAIFTQVMGRFMSGTKKEEEVKIECKLHRWEYDHLGNMLCGDCNFKASP